MISNEKIITNKPALLMKIGVDTFLDPRKEGAVLNERAKKIFHAELVYLIFMEPTN